MSDRDRRASTAAASGIRAAARPSRPRCASRAARAGRAIAPAGASRGSREAVDLRDGGTRFGGFDVAGAPSPTSTGPIAAALDGLDALDQARHRRRADRARRHAEQGAARRQRHGRGVARGRARGRGGARRAAVALPRRRRRRCRCRCREIQIFGGGAHAGRRIDIQDLMVMPRRRVRRSATRSRSPPKSIAPPAS